MGIAMTTIVNVQGGPAPRIGRFTAEFLRTSDRRGDRHMTDPTHDKRARIVLGKRLAELRKAAGLTQHELATRISYGRGSVASAETAVHATPLTFWKRCDTALDSDGVLVGLYQRIEIARRERALATTAADLNEINTTTEATRRYQPVDPALARHWTAMLDVLAASHDTFGPARLHDIADGELALIHATRLDAIGVDHANLIHVEARWTEFASWTTLNHGSATEANRRLRSALALAQQAEQPALVAYILMRQAQHTADQRNATRTTQLAAQAVDQPRLSLRDRALCAIRTAQGHALGNNRAACRTALHLAYQLVTAADAGDASEELTIGRHCGTAYVAAHEGYCHLHLGRPDDAIAVLRDVLSGSSPWHVRPRSPACCCAWPTVTASSGAHASSTSRSMRRRHRSRRFSSRARQIGPGSRTSRPKMLDRTSGSAS